MHTTNPGNPSEPRIDSDAPQKRGYFGGRSQLAATIAAHECPEELEFLFEALNQEYLPVGVVEQMFVEQIAISRWRLRRARRFKIAAIVKNFTAAARDGQITAPPEATFLSGNDLKRLTSYTKMIDGQLKQALKELRLLQNDRNELAARSSRSRGAVPTVKAQNEAIPHRRAMAESPASDAMCPTPKAQNEANPHRRATAESPAPDTMCSTPKAQNEANPHRRATAESPAADAMCPTPKAQNEAKSAPTERRIRRPRRTDPGQQTDNGTT